MTPRTWDKDEFLEAYTRYRIFYKWIETDTSGEIKFGDLLKRYTDNEQEREELTAMYEVTRIMNKNGLHVAKVVKVTLSEDGSLDVEMEQPRFN